MEKQCAVAKNSAAYHSKVSSCCGLHGLPAQCSWSHLQEGTSYSWTQAVFVSA